MHLRQFWSGPKLLVWKDGMSEVVLSPSPSQSAKETKPAFRKRIPEYIFPPIAKWAALSTEKNPSIFMSKFFYFDKQESTENMDKLLLTCLHCRWEIEGETLQSSHGGLAIPAGWGGNFTCRALGAEKSWHCLSYTSNLKFRIGAGFPPS